MTKTTAPAALTVGQTIEYKSAHSVEIATVTAPPTVSAGLDVVVVEAVVESGHGRGRPTTLRFNPKRRVRFAQP